MAKAPDYLRARGLADDPVADPLPGFGFNPNTGMIVDPAAQSGAPGFATMPDDYQARVLALQTAVHLMPNAGSEYIVTTAHQFHAFLTNTEPQALPDPNKGRTFTDE